MDQHVANIAGKAGIDPNTIIAIIGAIGQIVSQFLAKCQPPPTPKSVMEGAGGVVGTFVMHKALRQNGVHPFLPEGQRVIAALKDEAKTVSEPDAEMLFALWQP